MIGDIVSPTDMSLCSLLRSRGLRTVKALVLSWLNFHGLSTTTLIRYLTKPCGPLNEEATVLGRGNSNGYWCVPSGWYWASESPTGTHIRYIIHFISHVHVLSTCYMYCRMFKSFQVGGTICEYLLIFTWTKKQSIFLNVFFLRSIVCWVFGASSISSSGEVDLTFTCQPETEACKQISNIKLSTRSSHLILF